jgi:biopolymer transport protein ExbD
MNNGRSTRALACSLAFLLHAAATAQATEPRKPRHSTTDQAVRQVIERLDIRPPRIQAGAPIQDGGGPVALLWRGADGVLRFEAIRRPTREEPGPDPEPALVEAELEEAEEPAAGAVVPRPAGAPVSARLSFDDGAIRLGDAKVDPEQLVPALRALRGPEEPGPTGLVLAPAPDAPLGVCVAVFAAAREAGFKQVMVSGGPMSPLSEADVDLLDRLAEALEWQPATEARGPMPALYNGELLLLFDAGLRWQDVLPIYSRCAMRGLWRLGFVATDGARRRFAVPLPVPVDHGR